MKHIKRFNESLNDEISKDIKSAVKTCFQDYMDEYSVEVSFQDGYYIPGYNFMSERFLKDLISKYPDDTQKFKGNNAKCIKVDFNNEGLGSGGRLELYLDENSQSLFDESIHNLKSQLNYITKCELKDIPKKLSPEFFGFNFLIIYE